MFAGTLMTPRIDAKIRSTLKHKKSNFKDILRERFRNQIRANRRTLFEKMRSFDDSEEVQNSLSSILRSEIQQFNIADHKKRAQQPSSSLCESEPEINHDVLLELMREIELELLDEQYQCIVDEYHKEEEEIVGFYEEERVVCPICQRGILQKPNFVDPISCMNCDLRLFSPPSLETFNESLKQSVEEHSQLCSSVPQFWILKEGSSNTLFMTCDQCSILRSCN